VTRVLATSQRPLQGELDDELARPVLAAKRPSTCKEWSAKPDEPGSAAVTRHFHTKARNPLTEHDDLPIGLVRLHQPMRLPNLVESEYFRRLRSVSARRGPIDDGLERNV
jgi:hypothetical protein